MLTPLDRSQLIIDQSWRRMSDGFLRRCAEGRSIESFPDFSEAAAEDTANWACEALKVIDDLDVEALRHEVALTLKILRFQLAIEAQALERYWLVQQCGWWPAMFPVAPYGSGHVFDLMVRTFTAFVFSGPGDCEQYLALLKGYSRAIEQVRQKLDGQAARGIRIPRAALIAMRTLVSRQAEAARDALQVDPARLIEIAAPGRFADVVTRHIEGSVVPAFTALLDLLDDDYAARAPEMVGMGQFKGGARIYEKLVTEHLSMPMTVEAVHRAGTERMAELEAEMASIRAELGSCDRDEFHRHLRTDPAWAARSVADLQSFYHAAICRIEPHIERLFHFKPAARYRVARLDSIRESAITYGYYQQPTSSHPDGVYYFNGAILDGRTLATEASRIFHELIPGHHFHLATQNEAENLHPLRKSLTFTAFNEGWAEYAATLAGEIGLYSDPHERYGRLLMEAFTAARLVVDTGLNALGWRLEQAHRYLREHTILSEDEIRSEALRYSTDIPAQSLAYKIGESKILGLRRRAKAKLRARFDIRDFHDVVLGSGAMPLKVLEWHVNRWLDRQSDGLGPVSPAT